MAGRSQVPRPPAGLATRGRALWRQVQEGYELDPLETELLHELCRVLDRCDQITKEIDGLKSLAVLGSAGQWPTHPLLGALENQQKLAVAALIREHIRHVDRGQRPTPLPSRTAKSCHRSQVGVDGFDVAHARSVDLCGAGSTSPLRRPDDLPCGMHWRSGEAARPDSERAGVASGHN